MHQFKMEVLAAVAGLAMTTCGLRIPAANQEIRGICPRDSNVTELANKLSEDAEIYFPGSDEFTAASTRWSAANEPQVSVVVVPGTENDVVETVKFSNNHSLPFLAFNGVHGSISTLGRMRYGVEIYLSKLSSVVLADDGQTATIGGGTPSKNVTDALWDLGKQTVTGTCECVSLLGPALGGGHGWLQGQHGLVADQFVSMNVVLAGGTLTTIDETSDLFYAMKGAGHNFGIVTSLTTKVYDLVEPNWTMETLIFDGDNVEAVYQAANDNLINGDQPDDLINWSYWYYDPTTDADKPVIAFYLIQQGDSVNSTITQAFTDIGALSTSTTTGTYRDLAAWTQISLSDRPCQKSGTANPRFPIYLEAYNATAQKLVYDIFSSTVTTASSNFSGALFMFEGYSMQGVRAIDSDSAAYAFRSDNLLIAPLLTYTPSDAALDAQAATIGNEIRQILHEGSGRDQMHVYLNYAFGDETVVGWYGEDEKRLNKLRALKQKYDPLGRFSFYGPIA